MTEIVVQAEIGGATIAFTAMATESFEKTLDGITRQVNRERAKVELVEVLTDILARRETVAQAVDLRRGLTKRRADERLRMRAAFEAAHQVANKRAEFSLNQQQRAQMAAFDTETEKQQADLLRSIEMARDELPKFEEKLARLERIIEGGKDRADVLYELLRKDDAPALAAE